MCIVHHMVIIHNIYDYCYRKNMETERPLLKRPQTAPSLPLLQICPGSKPLPNLGTDLQSYVANFIFCNPYRLDRLEALMAWCKTGEGGCDEDLYRRVVTQGIGAPVEGHFLTPDPTNVHSMFCNGKKSYASIDSDLTNYFNNNTEDGKFWKFFADHCFHELSMLPTSMCTAFLNSNDAQRRRWNHIFRDREYYWLMARTELGRCDLPEAAVLPPPNERTKAFTLFTKGQQIGEEEKDKARTLIDNGWEFDYLLQQMFNNAFNGITPLLGVHTHGEDPNLYDNQYEQSFNDCVDFLIENGIDPTITSVTITKSLYEVEHSRIHHDSPPNFAMLQNHYVAVKLRTIMRCNLFVQDAYTPMNILELICRIIGLDNDLVDYRAENGNGAYYSLSETLYELIIYLGSQTGSDFAKSGQKAAFRVPTSHEELLEHVNDNRTHIVNILDKVLSNECNYANNHPGDADSAKRLANAAMISEKLRYLGGEGWNVTLPREDQQLEHV